MEELKNDIIKKVIDRAISELANEFPELYYADSSYIANLVKEKFSTLSLNQIEKDAIKNLSVNDILILMSYKSNCC